MCAAQVFGLDSDNLPASPLLCSNWTENRLVNRVSCRMSMDMRSLGSTANEEIDV